jgi:hypothetical protein
MAFKRINLALSTAQMKSLDQLADKLGLDRTNAIRFCIAHTCEMQRLYWNWLAEAQRSIPKRNPDEGGG